MADKRTYEGIFILDNDLTEDKRGEFIDKIKNMIEKNQGAISACQELGRQKLAYEIKGKREGYYILVHFSLPADAVDKLKKSYVILDNLLKHHIVSQNEKASQKSQKEIKKEKTTNEAEGV